MADIAKLKVGQVLYDVQRMKMGNTDIKIGRLYQVIITEIDTELKWVLARWNHNPDRKYYQSQVKHWKTKEPKSKGKIWGQPNY